MADQLTESSDREGKTKDEDVGGLLCYYEAGS